MKCHQCGQTLIKEDDRYICPSCGTQIVNEAPEKSNANRVWGGILFLICIGLAGLMFYQGIDGYVLSIIGIPIPYSMHCAGVLFLIGAIFGILGVFGKTDVLNKK